MKLSLVIPVYGSASILREAHAQYTARIRALTTDYELVFRYDCSPDDSWTILQELAGQDAHVRVYANERNRGLGYTLRRLFADARGEYVLYVDADAYRCFDLTVLPNFLDMIRQYDVIVAARYEQSTADIPWYRLYASRLYHQVSKRLFGVAVSDMGSGMVLFRRSALQSLRLEAEGFDIHIEIFAKLLRAGYRVKEVDVNYTHWFGGSFGVFKHGWKTAKGTLRVWWSLRKHRRSS